MMPRGISKSVGPKNKCPNEYFDVKLVQTYLNLFDLGSYKTDKLTADGRIGPNTLKAIGEFQRVAVGMKYPDRRVDPAGRTFRYLTMFHSHIDQQRIEDELVTSRPSKRSLVVTDKHVNNKAGLNEYNVIYKGVKTSKQKVSEYAKNVVRMALKESGMSSAAITSTIRTPKEQASIMLRNAKKNYQKQLALYGRNGDSVLKVYNANKKLSDDDIIDLMVEKIEELEKQGKIVSRHCATEESYSKKNVFDIGLNSTKAINHNFSRDKFTKALKNLKKEGFIDHLIDETNKSNTCWHLEIIPNVKSIYSYDSGILLNPICYINGKLP